MVTTPVLLLPTTIVTIRPFADSSLHSSMAASAVVRRLSSAPLRDHRLLRPFSSTGSESTITVETSVPFTGHKINPPSRSVETTPVELLSFFRDMSLMRRMEIAADSLYKSKLIRGFCHLYDGQESIAIGLEAAITKKDAIITAYRDHCICLGRGGTLVESFAELMGRRAGCSKGKGGSMHFYKKESGFFGGHGIVGAQVPLGCGLAFAQKYLKEGTVSFALYGDGAANQGQLFEALNISALWDLPAILVCENNHCEQGRIQDLNIEGAKTSVGPCFTSELHANLYSNYYIKLKRLSIRIAFLSHSWHSSYADGMGTAEWRSSKSPAYYKRGDYVPGLKVDGMDVLAVKQASKFAKEYALKNGPIILEMDTYRYHGHSMSDPGSTYRTRDEISGVRQERDPIERIRKLLLSHEIATVSDLKDIEKEVRREVEEAIAQAKENLMPDPSELFTNVYVKGFGVEVSGNASDVVKNEFS
ncbi:hypothetical protein ZIOFF_042650 [Zingiber officinale]|uniref:Dehydrogenase E1 component domain-containing protein n=1 Tax=Zingiber officinale TaxID=94328 RepID=A0A8J5FTK7_ZINOF|nr:hypothetical protein ZIOFF_042650 [Zingiber officinale]